MLQGLYKSTIRPMLEYPSVPLSGISATDQLHLEWTQQRAVRLITGASPTSNDIYNILLAQAGLPTLSSWYDVVLIVFVNKFLNKLQPDHALDNLKHWTKKKLTRSASAQHSNGICLPLPHKSVLIRSPLWTNSMKRHFWCIAQSNLPNWPGLRF